LTSSPVRTGEDNPSAARIGGGDNGLFEGSSGIDTCVSSTSTTTSGGIDQQALGNGVINHFTYDEARRGLEIPGFLCHVHRGGQD
jgi:hypothetical protein